MLCGARRAWRSRSRATRGRNSTPRTISPSSRAPALPRSAISSRAVCWNRTRRSANSSRPPPTRRARSSKPPHIIMVFDEFELRHPRDPGHQAPARLRRALQVERRQAALADGRRRGGPELVHRIQRAHGPVGALVRALRRFRHAHRGGPGRARPAEYAAPVRLQDLHALSDVRRVPERAAFPDHCRHPELPRLRRRSARTSSTRIRSTSTRRRTRSRSSAARTRCSCSSIRRRTTFPGTSASVPISRPNGAISATGPMSTSICGAST